MQRKQKVAKALASCALVLVMSRPALAVTAVNSRHLIVLREGVDVVWGSYVFAVTNDEDGPRAVGIKIGLPKETADFVPQEGLEPADLKPIEGGFEVNKEFPPGTHVITVGFKIPASFGRANLTLKSLAPVEALTLLSPKKSPMVLSGSWFKPADGGTSPDPEYSAFTAIGPLDPMHNYVLEIQGLPEGRSREWILGGAVGAVLLLTAIGLALKTRPKIVGAGEGESVLVG